MKKSTYDGKKIANLIITFLICLFKWACFIMTVICLGFTIGLIVMYSSRGTAIGESFITSVYSILSGSGVDVAKELIAKVGINNTVFAAISHGLSSVISFGIIYIIMDTVKVIYSSIYKKDMFTQDNIRRLSNLVYLTIILAFAPVIIQEVISHLTDGVDNSSISMSGVVYFCVAYVAKMIFIYGYDLENKVKSVSKPKEVKKVENKVEAPAKKKTVKKTSSTTTKKATTKRTTKTK